jgi:membrane-associated protease RseP (regulator of RpoE activity)
MAEPSPSIPTSTVEYYQPVPLWVEPRYRQRYWLHALLLVLTIFTTLVVGSHMEWNFRHGLPALSEDDNSFVPFFPIDLVWEQPARLLLGIPFSATLMLILLAHEMGHYLYCVHYRVQATLPFFIPFPTLIGTVGAFIRIRSPIRSRTALFDIGIAGPIAGFVVACATLAVSLGMSRALPASAVAAAPDRIDLHYPLIFVLVQRGLAALGLLRDATALPLDRIALHPVAIAAWVGMFATSLNLLPGGQLDGGHILFSISPRAHRFVSRLTILVLLPMAIFRWLGWLVWAVLLLLSSFRHPRVAEWPKVAGVRRWLAVFALLMLVLTLIPEPIAIFDDNGRDVSSLKAFAHQFFQK